MYRPTSQVHSPMSLETIVPSSSQDNEAIEAGSRSITPASFFKSNDDKQELEMRGLQEQNPFPGITQGIPTPESTVPNLDDDTLQDAQSIPSNNGKASDGEILPTYRKE